MKTIIFENNWYVLSIMVIIFTFISTFVQNKILIQVLKIDKKGISKIYLIQTIIISLIRILLPIQYYKVIESIVRIIIYKKVLSLRIEKALVAEVICIINYTVIELISVRLYEEVYNVLLFSESIKNFSLICCVSTTIILVQLITYFVSLRFNFVIEMPEYLSREFKNQIIQVSSIFVLLVILNEILLVKCISSIPASIYLLDIILLLANYAMSSKSVVKTLQMEKVKNEKNELEGNNDRLLKNYDDIVSFRHDFKNIMQGFGGFIATKDIEGLSKMYKDVIYDCQTIRNNQSFNKENINNPAIYNLINNKYLEAKKYGVKINLEIYIDVNILKITTYELCRILGVLIDNAIDAAKECEEKIISIKFIKDIRNNRNLIVIENTCKNYLIDISKIKQKGFSTKKNKLFHGLGLWRVNQIVKKNENLRLYTSRGKMFKQQLEIYNWE